MINRVVQEDVNGCGIAALAMVTDQTYDTVKSHFVWSKWNTGLIDFAIGAYLAEHGYAIAPKYPYYMPTESKRDVWPPKPFADLHIVSTDNHLVVMLRDGAIIDPAPSRAKPRAIEQYKVVYWVMGIQKIKQETD